MNEAQNTMVGRSVLVTLSNWARFPDGKQYDCVYGVICEWGDVWVKIHDVHIKQSEICAMVECDGVNLKHSIEREADEDTKEIKFVKSAPRVAMAAVKSQRG